MFKKTLLSLLALSTFTGMAYANLNVAYVSGNNGKLSDVLDYQLKNSETQATKPFFNIAIIHAANINNANGKSGTNPNNAVLWINPNTTVMVEDSAEIAALHNAGVKVLLSVLGNHEDAGWSCFTDNTAGEAGVKAFADQLVNAVNKYNLDGIDIDDEYSNCSPNDTSMIMVAQAIKQNPAFKGKLLTKALWVDSQDFTATYNGSDLADFLNYGWEMSYGETDINSILSPYIGYGMKKQNLLGGFDINEFTGSYGVNMMQQEESSVQSNGYAGMMYYQLGGGTPSNEITPLLNATVQAPYSVIFSTSQPTE